MDYRRAESRQGVPVERYFGAAPDFATFLFTALADALIDNWDVDVKEHTDFISQAHLEVLRNLADDVDQAEEAVHSALATMRQ